MSLKLKENDLDGRIVFEKVDEGILFGSLLTAEIFRSIDMSKATSEEILCIVVTSIVNQVYCVAANTDKLFSEILFYECIKSLGEMREMLISKNESLN